MKTLCLAIVLVFPLAAHDPLAQRIAHTNPTLANPTIGHGAAGEGNNVQSLLETGSLDTNLYFLHRGTIPPKGGVGHHFHNQCEEMFIILDGEAEFTIDGRTSRLKGPVGAPCRMGHSHAIYNPTDKMVQWMNINVSAMKGTYDAFDLGDGRSNVQQLDPVPVFITLRLDQMLLRPFNNMNGGTGTAMYARSLGTSIFSGPWAYVDHLVLPPGAATGAHFHNEVAEVYYVMNGEGTMAVAGQVRGGPPAETAKIKNGDAIPIQLSEIHSVQNTGTAPLEFMIIGISRDSAKRVDSIDYKGAPAPREGRTAR